MNSGAPRWNGCECSDSVRIELAGHMNAETANQTAAAKSVTSQARSVLSKSALVALVRRREPRGVGLYAVCAVLVVLYALSVLYGIGAEAPPSGPRLLDFVTPALWLSFPVAIALVQLRRPTVLGGCYSSPDSRSWPMTLTGLAVMNRQMSKHSRPFSDSAID